MNKKNALKRMLAYLFKSYKLPLFCVIISLIISSIAGISVSIFLRIIIDDIITPGIELGFEAVRMKFVWTICIMASIYVIGIICSFLYTRIMVYVTQNYLSKLRVEIFSKMEKLPIRYFDQHAHGDIMSTYTNDVDALRQLVNQSLPQILSTMITILSCATIMLSYSFILSGIILIGVILMTFITKKIGGNSSKYFLKQQKSIAAAEGFIEEMMNGQRVIKVFCHEEESIEDFKRYNEQLCSDSEKANAYANILMPIMNNLGGLLYVLVAIVGSLLVLNKMNDFTISGITVLKMGVVISFLTISRQFSGAIGQVSQQINSVVMGIAGSKRIFELLDETPEVDDGYVTLVNAKYDLNGCIVESDERTGMWAWKHPHQNGTITYTLLRGDIRFYDVDFGYNPDKIILHNVSLYAKPSQKIAFVGATGAGKTTITNLINRFYDLADGKIRYDDININKIKKADLRRSIGMVLQDTNLFTGTVMENIRYGKLDATDEEVYEAAKIANAFDFITRLPHGFNTMLLEAGANLSQGQRQLISIARAAVANAPVMILDEATSSIDTRTEMLVQRGTDQLMNGRTVFVIAHRLSTVQNSNAIMVLDHGIVIERGTHDELIAQKGVYYQLYTGAFELQ